VAAPLEGFDTMAPQLERFAAAARQEIPRTSVVVTGQYPLLLATQRRLLTTLGSSLALTVAAVAAVFVLLLRDLGAAARAMLPNLLPVVGVLGLMGWTGIPLDIATVMVAAVVLGIAVDDTLHTLGVFRVRQAGSTLEEAVVATLRDTGPAYLLTGAILVAGFGVTALSSFAPTSRFGLLAAVAMVLAVVADLLLLPALLAGGRFSARPRR